jgi:uncharacterized protein (TIGR01777 family)
VQWDPARGVLDARALEGLDAIVHLAGAPISRRWTRKRKREILESRTRSTSLLARVIASLDNPPSVWLSGSAVGYYGSRGDEVLTEESSGGTGFLADVVRAWERATEGVAEGGIRVTMLRTGVVLSPRGGMVAKLITPFRLGVGGRVGDGRQWLAWISLRDHVRAMQFLMASDLSGPVNLVAPNPVTGAEFARTFAHVLRRPSLVPVPGAALRGVFGEMADETILASQRATPARLLRAGFEFRDPFLEGALRHELGTR